MRPKAFDPDAALAAALEVFWSRGYEKTTLDDLMDGMQVGRQSLYDTFGDKRALYLRSLERYREVTQDGLRSLLASERPLRERLESLLVSIAKESKAKLARGCLLLSANLERDLGDAPIARLVSSNQAEVEAIFEEAFRRAQRGGELEAGKDPAALAKFFVATIQGMRSTGRAVQDRTSLERIARVALSVLD